MCTNCYKFLVIVVALLSELSCKPYTGIVLILALEDHEAYRTVLEWRGTNINYSPASVSLDCLCLPTVATCSSCRGICNLPSFMSSHAGLINAVGIRCYMLHDQGAPIADPWPCCVSLQSVHCQLVLFLHLFSS